MSGAQDDQEPHHKDCPLADPRVTNPRAQGLWCHCPGISAREDYEDQDPPAAFWDMWERR